MPSLLMRVPGQVRASAHYAISSPLAYGGSVAYPKTCALRRIWTRHYQCATLTIRDLGHQLESPAKGSLTRGFRTSAKVWVRSCRSNCIGKVTSVRVGRESFRQRL